MSPSANPLELSERFPSVDASIVRLSELPVDNPKLRLDAQFQNKAALDTLSLLRSSSHVTIRSICGGASKGRNVPYSDLGALPIVRSGDISHAFQPENLLRTEAREDAFLLRYNDILISSIGQGSIGKVQLFRHEGDFGTVSEVTVVRVTSDDKPAFVAAFLASKFGQAQIERYITGATGQLHLYPGDVDKILIPRLSPVFQARIAALYDQEWRSYKLGQEAQERAQDLILTGLNLEQWHPDQALAYTAKLQEVMDAGRIDAQYFRPIFGEVERKLTSTGSSAPLGKFLLTNRRGAQPEYADEGLPVVNSKHVRVNRVVLSEARLAAPTAAPIIIETDDVLLNGTGVGTIGRAAAYLHTTRAIPDNHVTVLRTNALDPVYLAAFLNSVLGQLQIERYIKGSSGQIELYPNEIGKVVVWEAPKALQLKVRAEVLSAFSEERQAEKMRDVAQRAVETAVLEGEDAAMAMLRRLEVNE